MTPASDNHLDAALIAALHKEDYQLARDLVNRGANPNSACKDQVSALMHALYDKDDALAALLIEKGADINTPNPWGETPLIQVVRGARKRLFECLLTLNPDIIAADNEGRTALHYAVDLNKTIEMAAGLIAHGADVNAKTKNGDTPLMLAARRGKISFADLLIKNGADINAKDNGGDGALKHAAFAGRLEMVKFLVKNGATINALNRHRDSALYWAVCGGYADVVEFLAESGAETAKGNQDGETPLMRAASGLYKPGHVEILNFLIKQGADIHQANQSGITPLMKAAGGGHPQITRILLENGASVNAESARGETALVMACRVFRKGSPEVVEALLEYGADLDVRDQWKKSLLHLAAENGNMDIVSVLLKAGVDPNGDAGSAIRAAVEHDYGGIVRLLIEGGADVDLSDDSGRTALMMAVSRRHYDVADMLLAAGAEVNAASRPLYGSSDVSVLMYALGYNDDIEYERSLPPKISVDFIGRLLEKGADPHYVNQRGVTPLSLAQRKKNTRLIGRINTWMKKSREK